MPAAVPASEPVAIFPKTDIMSENRMSEDVCLKMCLKNVVRE
jgi:hypothetical protein